MHLCGQGDDRKESRMFGSNKEESLYFYEQKYCRYTTFLKSFIFEHSLIEYE